MKELSIKEKAKRYDEAITKGKQIQNTPYTPHWDIMKEVAEHLLPELKESENEMIRKQLLKHLREVASGKSLELSTTDYERGATWVEKQGQQKPAPILDIEIPFGAKDSELQEVSYHIPEGFHAEIDRNKVVIKKGEQKSAWSSKDEYYLNNCITKIEIDIQSWEGHGRTMIDVDEEIISWLKSLKDRVQPKQE